MDMLDTCKMFPVSAKRNGRCPGPVGAQEWLDEKVKRRATLQPVPPNLKPDPRAKGIRSGLNTKI